MSSYESEDSASRYEFKGKFGAAPSVPPKIEEATHEEIDAFVKEILGLNKEKE